MIRIWKITLVSVMLFATGEFGLLGQESAGKLLFEGGYSGRFMFTNGSTGLITMTIQPDGKLSAHFDNRTKNYSYDLEGTISDTGKVTAKVIFNGAEWGTQEGSLKRASNGRLVGRLEETPNGQKSWGSYQVELKKSADQATAKASVAYEVTMTTTLVVPNGNDKIDRIRVYHALPTKKKWHQHNNRSGATNLTFSPNTAEQAHHELTDSDHLLWTTEGQQQPGRRLTWVSKMNIVSAERTLSPKASMVKWEDYDRPPEDKTAIVDAELARRVHPSMSVVAASIKKSYLPENAVPAMCKWIVDNLKYDASARHSATDIDGILQNRSGHCGHQATVLHQLATSVGIPIRSAFGMNLYAQNGRDGNLQKVRADYTNIHTWAEVYFPGHGWVEVDPSLGERAYSLPPQLIQCNRWFQNYSIWLREAGAEKQPSWMPVPGGFKSEYGVEHIIRFTKIK